MCVWALGGEEQRPLTSNVLYTQYRAQSLVILHPGPSHYTSHTFHTQLRRDKEKHDQTTNLAPPLHHVKREIRIENRINNVNTPVGNDVNT